jgi:hypothetical protein
VVRERYLERPRFEQWISAYRHRANAMGSNARANSGRQAKSGTGEHHGDLSILITGIVTAKDSGIHSMDMKIMIIREPNGWIGRTFVRLMD